MPIWAWRHEGGPNGWLDDDAFIESANPFLAIDEKIWNSWEDVGDFV